MPSATHALSSRINSPNRSQLRSHDISVRSLRVVKAPNGPDRCARRISRHRCTAARKDSGCLDMGSGFPMAPSGPSRTLPGVHLQQCPGSFHRWRAPRAKSPPTARVPTRAPTITIERTDFRIRGATGRIFASEGRGFHFRPVGRLRLKGLAQPLAAVVIEWEPATTARAAEAGAAEPRPPRARPPGAGGGLPTAPISHVMSTRLGEWTPPRRE